MTYTPTFICPHCQKEIHPQGITVVMCDCAGAREEWERKHRADMERRKRARRGTRKRRR